MSHLVRRDPRPRFPPLPLLLLLLVPPGRVNNVISPKGKGDKHVEEFPPNWSILRRRRTKFGSLLCPASLAALRALALWLLWPCLKTAPTAFAFVPAIRFSTSGGLYGGNTKEQKTSKKLLKKQTKVMNTFQVIMHTCIK